MSNDMPVFPMDRRFHPFLRPGQIWKIRRSRQPLDNTMDLSLFSRAAQSYWSGEGADRYVMIVQEPNILRQNAAINLVVPEISVMVLSAETQHLSHLDLLLPANVTGLDLDLLAETWHVLIMLTNQLLEPIGQRLPRPIYDLLLSVGDQDPQQMPSIIEITNLGLQIGDQQTSLSIFHQQERNWSDILRVPVAAQQVETAAHTTVTQALEQVIQLEQDWIESPTLLVILSQWLQEQFTVGWLAISEVIKPTTFPDGLIPIRGTRSFQTAEQVLGMAAASLGSISPSHETAEVCRIKQVNLGAPIALAISVNSPTPTAIEVLLQVYPLTPATHLPPQLQLILLDHQEQIIRTVTAQSVDLCIQLKLTGQIGEQFKVQLCWGASIITENFLL